LKNKNSKYSIPLLLGLVVAGLAGNPQKLFQESFQFS